MSRRIKRLAIHVTQGEAGTLERASQFFLRTAPDAIGHPERAVSLTMPPKPEDFASNTLFPILAMNLPEGYLLDRVVGLFRKVMDIEPMNLLAITSTPTSGRVWASLPEPDERLPARSASPSIALKEILAAKGGEALFEELVDRFALNASISGVQPKVVGRQAHRRTRGRWLSTRPTSAATPRTTV